MEIDWREGFKAVYELLQAVVVFALAVASILAIVVGGLAILLFCVEHNARVSHWWWTPFAMILAGASVLRFMTAAVK